MFDIRHEPWIPVVLHNGTTATLSLVDAFARANEVVDIAGVTSLETTAVFNTMLSMVYTANDNVPATLDDYIDSQSMTGFGITVQWLLSQHHGFDLFDDTHPFQQHTGLHAYIDQHGTSPRALLLDAANNTTLLMDHRHAADGTLTPAEALRGLLVTQQFAPGGILAGGGNVTLDGTVASGPGGKTAPFAGRLIVRPTGPSLAATLRLNLTQGQATGDANLSWTLGAARTIDKTRDPSGRADLLTWMTRTALLRRNNAGMVDRVLLCKGETPARDLADWLEPDAVVDGDKTVSARKGRALWRNADALYASLLASSSGQRFGQYLSEYGEPVDLHVTGMAFTNKNIHDFQSASFPFLASAATALHDTAASIMATTDHVSKALFAAASRATEHARPAALSNAHKAIRDMLLPQDALWAWSGERATVEFVDVTAGGTFDHVRFADDCRAAGERLLNVALARLPRSQAGAKASAHARSLYSAKTRDLRIKEQSS